MSSFIKKPLLTPGLGHNPALRQAMFMILKHLPAVNQPSTLPANQRTRIFSTLVQTEDFILTQIRTGQMTGG